MTCEDPGLAPELRAALCDRLILKVLNRRFPGFSPDRRPDLYDLARKAVERAAATWNPRGSPFTTHAAYRIEYELMRPHRSLRPHVARQQDIRRRNKEKAEAEERVRECLGLAPEWTRPTLAAVLVEGSYPKAAVALGVSRETARRHVREAEEALTCEFV